MLVLSRRDVETLLDLDELIEALARAHAELSAGSVSMPARIAAFAPGGLLGAMPAYLPSVGLGAKLVSLFPQNTAPLPTHQAAIVLFDGDTGMVTALMDGTYITAMRTAAAAALAEVRVAGRGQYEEAVRGADVIHATTHSAEPILRAEWLADGAHVSSIGYNTAGSELDQAIVDRASLVCVESRDSSFAPPPGGATELVGRDPSSVVELGELVAGSRPGRGSESEITLYKSVGVAIQDLAAAALVLRAARERNIGLEFELEEMHA
jgi:alanine dehydrogenase